MKHADRRQQVAAALAVVGGSLGAAAGVTQAAVGSQIPGWTGNKGSPLALGLLTILLSGISLGCAALLRSASPLRPGRRVAAALGLLIPGGLCFSTVGALWYLPGLLLLSAAALVITAGEPHETRASIGANLPRALVSLLGGFELLMAVSAGPVPTIAVGVLSGMALAAAPWAPAPGPRVVLLLLGTLPFAVVTWWSLASPLLAVLALAIGLATFRHPTDDKSGLPTSPASGAGFQSLNAQQLPRSHRDTTATSSS